MKRYLAIATALTLTHLSPVNAQDTCAFAEGSPENCTRFVGCINTDGTHFHGTATGWENGALTALTSTGETCTGTWSFNPLIEKGDGLLTCSNGEEGRLTFFTRDDATNAISGIAITNQGNRLQMWSSNELPTYLARKFPDGNHPGFQCGETWIGYPESFPR